MSVISTPEEFINSFTGAVVDRDFAAAEAMLGPWLRADLPVGGLKKMLRKALGTAPPPYEADPPSLLPHNTPASLRESVAGHAAENGPRTLANYDGESAMFGPPSFPIAAEITDANYSGTFRVELVPDPDLEAEVDFSYALFLVVVELDGGLAIGYLEPAE